MVIKKRDENRSDLKRWPIATKSWEMAIGGKFSALNIGLKISGKFSSLYIRLKRRVLDQKLGNGNQW